MQIQKEKLKILERGTKQKKRELDQHISGSPEVLMFESHNSSESEKFEQYYNSSDNQDENRVESSEITAVNR